MDNNRLDIGLIQKIYIFTKFPIMPSKLVDFLLFWYMIYFKKNIRKYSFKKNVIVPMEKYGNLIKCKSILKKFIKFLFQNLALSKLF